MPREYTRLATVLSAALVLGIVSTATAVPITPGNTVALPGSNYAATVLQDPTRTIQLRDASNNLLGTLTLRDRVTELSGGTINFERFIQAADSNTATLGRFSVAETGFTGFATDVDWDPTSVFKNSNPTMATRDASGNTVTFHDFNPDTLSPTQATYFFTNKTDATNYALIGTTTVTGEIGGVLVSGSVATFAPTNVPEPATLGGSLVAALMLVRSRKS